MSDAIEAACRAHAPQWDGIDPEIQHYAREQMRAALTAYEAAKGGGVAFDPRSEAAYFASVWKLSNYQMTELEKAFTRSALTSPASGERANNRKDQIMDDAQIKYMVGRFLGWKLPTNFNPDDGITFNKVANKGTAYEYTRVPSGTNLLDYTQAEAMVRYMLDELPPASGERDDDLTTLMQRSIAAFAKLSPDEQDAHMKLQRESWVRGEMGIGSDKDEAEARMAYRHKKRGTEYVLIGIGKMQSQNWTDFAFGVDMREVAIYRAVDDGSLWVRPREEFEDGQFEALPTPKEPS